MDPAGRKMANGSTIQPIHDTGVPKVWKAITGSDDGSLQTRAVRHAVHRTPVLGVFFSPLAWSRLRALAQ